MTVLKLSGVMGSQRSLGMAMAAVGAIAFSGKAIVAKMMYRYGVDAFTVLGLRMTLALPFFLAMVWWSSRPRQERPPRPLTARDGWQIAALGFCGYYLASTLDFLGLQYISASLERAILYLNPTVVLLLGVLLGGERPRPAQIGAVALAYAGVMVVWLHDWHAVASPVGSVVAGGGDATHAVTTGSLLVLGSAVAYAVYLRGSARLVDRFGSVRLVGLASTLACAMAVAQWALAAEMSPQAAPAVRGLQLGGIAWQVWALSLLNAVACTVLPVWLVMRAVQLLGPSVASQVGMVGPLSTIWLASWFLDEPVTAHLMVGTGAILAGIIWLARAGRTQAAGGSKAKA